MDLFGDEFKEAPANGDAGQEFLQNTQDDIKNLESQFLSTDISDPFAVEGTNENSGFEMVNGDANEGTAATGGDSDIDILAENTENTIEASQHEGLETDMSNLAVLENAAVPQTSSSPVNNSGPSYEIKVEPESIRQWRTEFQARIEEADAKEEAAKQEMLAQAKKDLDEWEKQRKEALEKTKAANREEEQAFIQERESREEEGKSRSDVKSIDWAHTADLCDFNPKSSKGSKDTSRMRGLFLHLKQGNNE